jgi:tartrate-resistant acid phosphatase type 5
VAHAARYYFEEAVGGDVLFSYLDTTPLYYVEQELHSLKSRFEHVENDAFTESQTEQLNDLERELAKTRARTIIAIGDHPVFSSAENAVTEGEHLKRMREALAGIFESHMVSAYYCGHEHVMEHVVSGGVHYFVVGEGSKISDVQVPAEGSVFAFGRQGFAAIALEDGTQNVQFIDFNGHVVHTVTIERALH